LLLRTLASLEQQTVDPSRYEVCVGVDGSTDGTGEALRQLNPRYPLRWVNHEHRGMVATQNAAGRLASYEVVIVLGDDMLASPDLVAAHLDAQQRHGTVLVQGEYPLGPGCRGGATLVYERARAADMARLPPSTPGRWYIWGGNISVRRTTWLELGGYDETLPPYGVDDLELGLRIAALGVPFIYEPRARSLHMHAVRPRGFARKMYNEGRAVVQVGRKHGLPLEAFPGSAIRGPVDRAFEWGWRRLPRAMEAIGSLLPLGLQAADLTPLTPAQIAAARLVRRFYRVGGITRERLVVGGKRSGLAGGPPPTWDRVN
jgi:GT2 family glycosyltransferase